MLSLPNQLGSGSRYYAAASPANTAKQPTSAPVDLSKLYGSDTVLLNKSETSATWFTANMVQQAHAAEVSEALQDLFEELDKAGKKGKNRHESSKSNGFLLRKDVSFIV